MEKIFITTDDAAKLVNYDICTIRGLSSSRYKNFPAVIIGQKYLINRIMLISWASERQEEGEMFEKKEKEVA